MKTGERIKRAREARGLTQLQLAVALNVDPVTISRAERDKRVSLTTLEKIAHALDLKLSVSVTDKRAA